MAMFFYNPSPNPGIRVEHGKGWIASIEPDPVEEKGLFVVTNEETKHIVDGFVNKTRHEFYEVGIKNGKVGYNQVKFGQETDIWYSFDPGSCNFHIVPDESVKIEENGKEIFIYELLLEQLKRIKNRVNKLLGKVSRVGGGNKADTYNHRYVRANIGQNQYLMSFNRLWRGDKDGVRHICNNFGQAQFMCYPIEDKQINLFPDGFKLMYPNSAEDEDRIEDAGHRVYNAPYDIKSNAEEIAKCFIGFI